MSVQAALPAVPSPKPVAPGQGLRVMLLLTMAVWGGNLSVVKLLVERFDPLVVSAARMVVASLALLAVLRWRGLAMPRPSPRQALAFVACAVLMVYLNQMVFTLGVQRTAAANAALIIALNPLVSAVWRRWCCTGLAQAWATAAWATCWCSARW